MVNAAPGIQWSVNEDKKYPVGEKTGEVRLNAEFTLYAYQPDYKDPVGRFLLVSLTGTSVAPTQDEMERNALDIRGFFTESVEISMAFQNTDGLVIKQDSPETTPEAGSVTSSVSQNFNGGFFGADLTAGAGLSIGNSVTASLQDFSVINHSDNTVVRHTYKMAMSRGGDRYDVPTDLLDLSAGGQFLGAPLHELSARATSNLPIVSQVLFWTPRDLKETRKLAISITHVTRKVEKTFKLFSVDVENWSGHNISKFEFDINFGRVVR